MRVKIALWAAIGAYACGFASLSVLRHRSFSTGRFDLGNMVQAVWSTAHGRPLAMTDLEGNQIVRLGAHVDPILALLAPLWWLWPSPSMLLTLQAVVVALGALPVFWLARRHLASERAALGFALAYLLYPALQWMTLADFHPVALATPFLLFAFWYLDGDRLLPFAVFAVLAALTKEHVPLAVAGLGAWYALDRGRRRAGIAIAALSLAWTAVAVLVVIPAFSEEGRSSFLSRYGELGDSPGDIVETAVRDPRLVASTAVSWRALGYLGALLLPLLLLPLAAPLVLLGAAPELALNVLSSTETQTSIHYHYAAATIPVLVAAAVLGAGRVARSRPAWRDRMALATVIAAVVAGYRLGPLPLWQHVPGGETLGAGTASVSEHDRVAARALRLVPDDAVVSASNTLGAHLSARRRVLSFPFLRDADWVAVDETRPSYADRAVAPREAAVAVAALRRNRAWRLVFERDDVLVFRRR